jgi:hypothetical protein
MIGVDRSHCYLIILSLVSSWRGVMLPHVLERYCNIVRAATCEKPLMWFSIVFRKMGSLMALMICCLMA